MAYFMKRITYLHIHIVITLYHSLLIVLVRLDFTFGPANFIPTQISNFRYPLCANL